MTHKQMEKQKPSIFVGILITVAFLLLTLLVSRACNWLFVKTGLTESQADHIAGMIEGVVAAMATGFVIYQLRYGDYERRRQTKIEEADFLLEYNQSFIQDPNMAEVEHRLEVYAYPEYEGERNGPLITPENRQKFVNYLVYLEGLASLVLNGVLSLESIDDLMAYRFFLAVNTPALQEDQLTRDSFAPYYRGCFRIYEKWSKYREDNELDIPLKESSLDKWENYKKYAGSAS